MAQNKIHAPPDGGDSFSTLPTALEWTRIKRAFAAIRKAGGITVTGLCCQGCSWAQTDAKGADDNTTVAIHHDQGIDQAFPEGTRRRMARALCIYHGGDSAFVCEALREQGLRVHWDGDMGRAIEVLPDVD